MDWIKRKFKEYFGGGLSFLIIGQIIVFGSQFLALPFISRFYSEETLGAWALLQSIAVGLYSFGQLRTDLALMQAKSQEERSFLLFLGGLSFTFVVFLFCLASQGSFFNGLRLPFSYSFIFLLGFCLTLLVQASLLGQKEFKRLTKLRVIVSFSMFVGALVLYKWSENGLLWALFGANTIPLFFYLDGLSFKKNYILDFWIHCKSVYQTHGHTLSYTTLQSIIDAINHQYIYVVLSNYYSLGVMGAYFLAEKLCAAPITLLGASVNQFNFKMYSDLQFEGNLRRTHLLKEMKKWTPIGLLYYTTLFFFSFEITDWFYGKNVVLIASFLKILVVPSFLKFTYQPASSLFIITGKQKLATFFATIYLVRFFLAFFLMANGQPVELVILWLAMITSAYLIFNFIVLYKLMD